MALVCQQSTRLLGENIDLNVKPGTKLVCMAIDAMIAGDAEEVG